MTRDELRAAYPGAADVVEFFEFDAPTFRAALPSLTADGWTPKKLLEYSKKLCEDAVEHDAQAARDSPQLDHPDCLRYLMARMGAL